MSEKQYRRVKITAGKRGWGGPLIIEPKPGRELIYCVTGGGIHPIAQLIADLTGGTPFDGFKSKADFDKIAVAVIDCGGTARVGVYPMKGVPTVDVYATKPSGPLFRFIKEDNFVSGVGENQIELLDDGETPLSADAEPEGTVAEAVKDVVEDVQEKASEAVETVVEEIEEKAEEVVEEAQEKKKGLFGRLFG